MIATDELRFSTYLVPGLPRSLFEAIIRHVARETGRPVSLRVEPRRSGPFRTSSDPFSDGDVDFGFMSAPAYLSLREREKPGVELLPVAPVFVDPRACGRPLYFLDVIAHRESGVTSFRDLANRTWAYNDTGSVLAYFSLLEKLAGVGDRGQFFRSVLHARSDLGSINLVASRVADAAAIDSNVLTLQLLRSPGLVEHVRVVESWGPYPVQPVVVRASLPWREKAMVVGALLSIGEDPQMQRALASHGVTGFARVSEAFYEGERLAFRACEYLAGLRASPHPAARPAPSAVAA